MSEMEMLDRLAAAVASKIQPPVRIEDDLWSIENIAAYLKRDASTIRERIACLPSFPKAIRIPAVGVKRSQPLYKESEVRCWAERHQERN